MHEVERRQCVFCKEPLSFWFAVIIRNFGLLGSECKYGDVLGSDTFVGRSESES